MCLQRKWLIGMSRDRVPINTHGYSAEECVRNNQYESIIDYHRQKCLTLTQQNGAMLEVNNADAGGDVKPARATSRKRPPSEVARSPHTPASVKAGPTTPTAVDIQQVCSSVHAHFIHIW